MATRESPDKRKVIASLTVHEPRAQQRAVRDTRVVHRAPRPIECIRERDHVAHRSGRPDVLHVLSRGVLLATLPELRILAPHDRRLSEQRFRVCRVGKIPGILNAVELDRAVPEGVVVRNIVEADDVSGATERAC